MVLTCCPYLGNGMADFIPGVIFGMKYRCIGAEFSPERLKLIKLRSDMAEGLT